MFGCRKATFAVALSALALAPILGRDLVLGEDAPDFTLLDQEGFSHVLNHHRGQYVLLFFYPRDFIPYSVAEVKAFERAYAALKEKNVVIYGVSNDFQSSHFEFHKKFGLTYDLLSDPDENVIKMYGAKSFWGRRFITYLIGPDGRVFKKYIEASPETHPALVLNDITNR